MITTASPGQVEEVIVSGIGSSEIGAINNAAKNAIQQVVGMYIKSDTLMKNQDC